MIIISRGKTYGNPPLEIPRDEITSAECERSFSTLRRLKTYLRATITSERESGLALMNIHYGRQIDISATIDLFARKLPRRLLSDILAE